MIWILFSSIGLPFLVASITALHGLANLAGRGTEIHKQSLSTLVSIIIITALVAISLLMIAEYLYNYIIFVPLIVFVMLSLFNLTLLEASIMALHKLANLAGRGKTMPRQSISVLAYVAIIAALVAILLLALTEVFYNHIVFVSPVVDAMLSLFNLTLLEVSITALYKLIDLASGGEAISWKSISVLASITIITAFIAILVLTLTELFYNHIAFVYPAIFVIFSLFSIILLKICIIALFKLIKLASSGEAMPRWSKSTLVCVTAFTLLIGILGSAVVYTLFPSISNFTRIIWMVLSVIFAGTPLQTLAKKLSRIARRYRSRGLFSLIPLHIFSGESPKSPPETEMDREGETEDK